jgi:hypothetical protein
MALLFCFQRPSTPPKERSRPERTGATGKLRWTPHHSDSGTERKLIADNGFRVGLRSLRPNTIKQDAPMQVRCQLFHRFVTTYFGLSVPLRRQHSFDRHRPRCDRGRDRWDVDDASLSHSRHGHSAGATPDSNRDTLTFVIDKSETRNSSAIWDVIHQTFARRNASPTQIHCSFHERPR